MQENNFLRWGRESRMNRLVESIPDRRDRVKTTPRNKQLITVKVTDNNLS